MSVIRCRNEKNENTENTSNLLASHSTKLELWLSSARIGKHFVFFSCEREKKHTYRKYSAWTYRKRTWNVNEDGHMRRRRKFKKPWRMAGAISNNNSALPNIPCTHCIWTLNWDTVRKRMLSFNWKIYVCLKTTHSADAPAAWNHKFLPHMLGTMIFIVSKTELRQNILMK